MRYLKTFELFTGNEIDYDVNDIVVHSQGRNKNNPNKSNTFKTIIEYDVDKYNL